MIDGRHAKDGTRVATFAAVQPLLAYAAAHLDDDVSLTALAEKAGFSAFYLPRIFSAAVGETPKQLAASRATRCSYERFGDRLAWRRAPIAGADLPTASPRRRLGNTPDS